MRTYTLWRSIGAVVVALSLLTASCVQESESSKEAAVRARAERLLDALREQRWSDAAGFVSTDALTLERMEIPESANPETSRTMIAGWFETLYENVPPGHVYSVEFDPQDPALAVVTYTAGDLDTLIMRLSDGEWYYAVD